MEDSTIKGFLARFPKDFARPNRYKIEFIMPPGVPAWGGFMNSEAAIGTIQGLGMAMNQQGAIEVSCHAMTFPEKSMMVYTHSQHSVPYNVPYSLQFAPITFSFYCSSDLRERHFFEIWLSSVINLNDNSINFFDEYTQNIKMWQLDRSGNKTYGVELYGAFPLSVGEVQYEYSSNNAVQSCPVTFSYKLWKNIHDTTEIIIY